MAWLPMSCGKSVPMVMSLAAMPVRGPLSAASFNVQSKASEAIHVVSPFVRTSGGAIDGNGG
jgi:hypothetical protein